MFFSIHTFELHTYVKDIKEFNYITEVLQQQKPSYYVNEIKKNKSYHSKIYKYYRLKIAGINNIEIKKIIDVKTNCTIKMHCYIRINPYNILHNYLGKIVPEIIEPDKIDIMLDKLYSILSKLLGNDFTNRLKLNRVDYTGDLQLSSQREAEEYLELLKKGVTPPVLKKELRLNERQHRYLPYENSIVFKCKSYRFQIYLKKKQMEIAKHRCDGELANGLLRFEIQAKANKIKQLHEKYLQQVIDWRNIALLKYAPEIARAEISKLVMTMVGEGNFVTVVQARKMISEQRYRVKTENRMLELIEYNSSRKYTNILDDLDIGHDVWKRIWKKFNKLGISPIPISNRYEKESYPGFYLLFSRSI